VVDSQEAPENQDHQPLLKNDSENDDDETQTKVPKNEDCGDCLMNVNVKERRQILMQVLNDQILKGNEEKFATLSRIAAKNASIVKMAVRNLDNPSSAVNNQAAHDDDHLETASILAIEASSKVKLMVSKFDHSKKQVLA